MKIEDNSLKKGIILEGKYRIEELLGEGSFGKTYKSYNIHLDIYVVIKEYFPDRYTYRDKDGNLRVTSKKFYEEFKKGLKRFLTEARTLHKFKHPNIVKILTLFEANNTAYFVMPFEEGIDLERHLENVKKAGLYLTEDEILSIFVPILNGLREVHLNNILHRDIKPSNIFIRKNNMPMLIDFGAARNMMGKNSKLVSIILTENYAPPEQFANNGNQGPWTDIYALGMALYQTVEMIDSLPKTNDRLIKNKELEFKNAHRYSDTLISTIKKMTELSIENRLKSVDEVLEELSPTIVKTECKICKKRKENVNSKSICLDCEELLKEEKKGQQRIKESILKTPKKLNTNKTKSDEFNKYIATSAFYLTLLILILVLLSYFFNFRSGSYTVEEIVVSEEPVLLLNSCKDKDSKSCLNLAKLYESGDGVPKDISKAKEFYGKACEFGINLACEKLNELKLNSLLNSCKDKDSKSCYKLAKYYESNHLIDKALTNYQKACDLGYKKGCDRVETIKELWQKVVKYKNNIKLYSAIKTEDGGVLAVGNVELSSNYFNIYLIRLDENGNKVWFKRLHSKKSERAYSIIKSGDGNYLIAGDIDFYENRDKDFYIVKIDRNGNRIWSNSFGDSGTDIAKGLVKLDNGGYLLVGYTDSYGRGGNDIYLSKLDNNGDKVWQKTFGGANKDRPRTIVQTTDGGFLILAFKEFNKKNKNIYLIKLDRNGDTVWEKTYGGSKSDIAESLVNTDNGNYLIVGYTYSFGNGDSDVYLIKIDKDGNKIWQKTFGGKKRDVGESIVKVSGGYLIAGHTYSFGEGKSDVYLIKTDKDGNKIWQKSFGGDRYDWANKIIKISSLNSIIVGVTNSFDNNKFKGYFIKIDNDGNSDNTIEILK